MEPIPSDELELETNLLRQVGRGDRASFGLLYDRYAGILFATALRIVNDRPAAEDVLQEVFIQIWEKAPLYDSTRGKPLAWAITLTRNKAIDRLRSQQRRNRLNEDAEREARVFATSEDRGAGEMLDLTEKGRQIRELLHTLPAEQRQAIELAFFSGMTQAEIAEHSQEPLGTVKARIRRGMLKLRDALNARP